MATPKQIEQQQLSWLLYQTRGALGNISLRGNLANRRALLLNVEMVRTQLKQLESVIEYNLRNIQ